MKTQKRLLKKSDNSEFSSWPSLQSHQGFSLGSSGDFLWKEWRACAKKGG